MLCLFSLIALLLQKQTTWLFLSYSCIICQSSKRHIYLYIYFQFEVSCCCHESYIATREKIILITYQLSHMLREHRMSVHSSTSIHFHRITCVHIVSQSCFYVRGNAVIKSSTSSRRNDLNLRNTDHLVDL